MITKEQREKDRAICEVAPDGPWTAVEVQRGGGWESALRLPSGGHVLGIPSTMLPFIARARAALLDRPRGAIGHALDVAARAEVAARTRQHHGADVVGGTQPTQGCDERVGGRDIDRVLCRWPVQREDGHAVRALEEDAVARHVRG